MWCIFKTVVQPYVNISQKSLKTHIYRTKRKPGNLTISGHEKKHCHCIVIAVLMWQGRQDSNPQPTVLETVALPLSHSPISVVTNRSPPDGVHHIKRKKAVSILSLKIGMMTEDLEVPFASRFSVIFVASAIDGTTVVTSASISASAVAISA